MTLSIQVRSDNRAVVVTADASMLVPLRAPLTAEPADAGVLLRDDEDSGHQALLSVWRHQATIRAGRDDNRKASA